ncbi:glycosyltransferase family 4 protein [Nitratireductor luteus]|uniref:glycosyltransferase family 4 protein n=1 Tax=Nitratireductor luteus TaxID=2976980 RepID=UPI00223FFF85|nr:glycosyltransferase family 4 protein [Nitratireductor luteus]
MGAHERKGGGLSRPAVRQVEIVAPNFKRRLSGVTSTIVQLVPLQAQSVCIATLGPGLPETLPRLAWRQVPGLLRRPQGRPFRIWHARRNIEMLAGVLLRDVLRAPVRLVFTSAAQRRHKPFTRWLIRRMDRVVATNTRSGSYLEVPHRVVMHGIDITRFHPPAGPEDRWQAAGLPGKYGIGCFGRIRHQKGTDIFVDVMIGLLPRYPDWTAVILGRVTAENRAFADSLQRKIEEAGLGKRILFLGEVPDVKPWYRRISLCVASSRNEGFGLTPLEAMASSTATVASDAGAYAELIVPGKTGAVTPAGDAGALARAIEPYLADPAMAERHGAAGLAHVRGSFGLENEAASLRAVYEELWSGQ